MKNEGVITMCVTGGLFVMGKLIGARLFAPRVFSVFDNGKQMKLEPLPANPITIVLRQDGFSYEIPSTEKNLLDLYYRVTHPPEQQLTLIPKPSIVEMPENSKLVS